jgi:hypothetical protein
MNHVRARYTIPKHGAKLNVDIRHSGTVFSSKITSYLTVLKRKWESSSITIVIHDTTFMFSFRG